MKNYIKITTPSGKYYRALVNRGRNSRKRFKTATQAEAYAKRWVARYKRLLLAPKAQHDDEIEYCQDCGCMLDENLKCEGDDIVRRPYVTASGDVYCSRCGREYDEEEERQNDEEACYYPDLQDADVSETDEQLDWEPELGLEYE